MESLRNDEAQLKWEQSIQKIKEYLKSLFLQKHKRKTKKISDKTNDELTKIMEQTEEEFDIDNEENKQWKFEDSSQEDGEVWDDMEENNSGDNWEEKQQGNNSWENEKKGEFETPPEDKDEYIPQDSEFGEAMWEQSRFAEVYPPFLGYYVQWKKSYFDRNSNLWSKKKRLTPFTHKLPEEGKKYTYTGVITAWVNAIPLPD